MRFIKIINKLKKDKPFYNKMVLLRSFYVNNETNKSIPKNGLKEPKTVEEHKENKKKYSWHNSKTDNLINVYDLNSELKNWEKLNFPDDVFDYFLFYNSIDKLLDSDKNITYKVIDTLDLIDKSGYKITYEKGDKDSIEAIPKITSELEKVLENKMIGIFIDRDMSKTELVALIKKIYETEIEPIQKSYGMKKDWARERPIKDYTKEIISYTRKRLKELKNNTETNKQNRFAIISSELNNFEHLKYLKEKKKDKKEPFTEEYLRKLAITHNLK